MKINKIGMQQFDKILQHIFVFRHKSGPISFFNVLVISQTRNQLIFLVKPCSDCHRLGSLDLKPCFLPISDSIYSISPLKQVILYINKEFVEDSGNQSYIFEYYFCAALVIDKDGNLARLKQDIEEQYFHEYKGE